MSDPTITLNQNTAECLFMVNNWGYKTVYNVCNNSTFTISWGLFDYLTRIFAIMVLTMIIISIAMVTYYIITE